MRRTGRGAWSALMVPQMPRSSLNQSKHAERNLLGWCITNYNIRCSSQPTGNPSGNRACIPARSGEESLCVLIRNFRFTWGARPLIILQKGVDFVNVVWVEWLLWRSRVWSKDCRFEWVWRCVLWESRTHGRFEGFVQKVGVFIFSSSRFIIL
jgi:hypothetical protein